MKNISKKISILFVLASIMLGCQGEDYTFGNLEAPSGITIDVEIVGQDTANPNGDGSGLVNFTSEAANAVSYKYIFSDGTTINSPSGITPKRFTKNGVNTYEVTVIASGKGGVSSSQTIEVTVVSNFTDDEAVQFLTGGTSKVWYWSASEPGHLGVGENSSNPENNFRPNYYAAAPFEKAGSAESSCIYEHQMTFSLEGGILKYEANNGGATFFNAAFNSVGGGSGGNDLCLAYDVSGVKTVQLGPSESILMTTNPTKTRGTSMTIADGGFMGYYIGQSTYEILEITENRMVVRSIPTNTSDLAWYHIFTTTPVAEQGTGGSGGSTEDFTNLVWEDNFNTDGAPDATKWSYDLGAGGWGNQEAQNYTSNPANIVVQGGNLVITAKAENLGSSNYTSARIKSLDKFEFTYGKVEVRAKLPSGGGTWPAAWMLGANFPEVGWPACGEIDIMEHKGNDPGIIYGTLHYPGNSGGNANSTSTSVANVSSEFHVYSVIWSASTIRFFVDGNLYKTFNNNNTVPFNSDFFLILNVAMGGNFGGTIDPAFTQSAMEVDYVKVYQ